MSQTTYNGKTFEQLTAWERLKLGIFTECAKLETALTNQAPYGFMRGDIHTRWTGYAPASSQAPNRSNDEAQQ